jgi:hypothetical protein
MGIGSVAVDGAVKPLLNAPPAAPLLLGGPAPLGVALLSACLTWPCKLGYVGLLRPVFTSRADMLWRVLINDTWELDLFV